MVKGSKVALLVIFCTFILLSIQLSSIYFSIRERNDAKRLQREMFEHSLRLDREKQASASPEDPPEPPKSNDPPPPKSTDYKCRAIFSINPGRAGSGLLHHQFEKYVDPNDPSVKMAAYHEHGAWTKEWNYATARLGLKPTYDARFEARVPSLLDATVRQGRIYAESTHFFIQSFWDVGMDALLDEGCRVDIVVLRRYIPRLAASLERNQWKSAAKAGFYYAFPNEISILTPPVIPEDEMDPFFAQCMYFITDIEAQAERFAQMYGDHPLVHMQYVDLDYLGSSLGAKKLAADMDLAFREGTDFGTTACKLANTKGQGHRNDHDERAISLMELYIQKVKEQGLYLPELPQATEGVYPPDPICEEFFKEMGYEE